MTATTIEYLDRPPVGDWFVLDVMREKARSREWIAPIIDVHPDEHCSNRRIASRSVFVRISGQRFHLGRSPRLHGHAALRRRSIKRRGGHREPPRFYFR